jgi:hypothetical protein
MEKREATQYLIRALCYAGSYGRDEHFEAATITGGQIAEFLTRAVSDERLKQNAFVLYGVRTDTWWRMLRSALAKLGDLDEMRVRELLEASGHWFWGQKPSDPKQIFSTHNLSRIYDQNLALNGWRLIYSQKHLRSIVDRFNA